MSDDGNRPGTTAAALAACACVAQGLPRGELGGRVAGAAPVNPHHIPWGDIGHDGLPVEAPEDTTGDRRAEGDVLPGEAERLALHQQVVALDGDHPAPAHPAFVHRLQAVRNLLMTRPNRHAEDVKIVVRARARGNLPQKRAQELCGEAPAEAFLEMAVQIHELHLREQLVADPVRLSNAGVEWIPNAVCGGGEGVVGEGPRKPA